MLIISVATNDFVSFLSSLAQSLFGPDFYQNMSDALAPGGVICTQAESVWLHMPLIKELIGSAKQYYASVEYAITYIPTYPCGSIGLLVCRKAFGGDVAGTRGVQDAAC